MSPTGREMKHRIALLLIKPVPTFFLVTAYFSFIFAKYMKSSSVKKNSSIAIFLQSSCIMIRRITIRNMDKESIMKIPVPAGAIPVLYMRNGSIQEKKRILCVKFQSRSGISQSLPPTHVMLSCRMDSILLLMVPRQ